MPGPSTKGRLLARLHEEVWRASRHGLPLALVVIRIRPAATERRLLSALARMAALFTRAIVRRNDVVGVLDSGEVGLVANTTREGAGALARDIIRGIQGFEFTHRDRSLAFELSHGVSCLTGQRTAEDLLAEARAALAANAEA